MKTFKSDIYLKGTRLLVVTEEYTNTDRYDAYIKHIINTSYENHLENVPIVMVSIFCPNVTSLFSRAASYGQSDLSTHYGVFPSVCLSVCM